MRIILLLICMCGFGFSGDVPHIPQTHDIAAWENALRPAEERFDPMLMQVKQTKKLTDGVFLTYLSSGKFTFTLFETQTGGILIQGQWNISVLHTFKEKGYRIIVTDMGTFFETQTKLFWIK